MDQKDYVRQMEMHLDTLGGDTAKLKVMLMTLSRQLADAVERLENRDG